MFWLWQLLKLANLGEIVETIFRGKGNSEFGEKSSGELSVLHFQLVLILLFPLGYCFHRFHCHCVRDLYSAKKKTLKFFRFLWKLSAF